MNANFINVTTQNSEKIEHQGNKASLRPYLSSGYIVKIERNGYYLLVKPSKVLVTIGNSSLQRTFNMKNDILNYYGRERINDKLVERFREDASNGKIKFDLNPEENTYSMK